VHRLTVTQWDAVNRERLVVIDRKWKESRQASGRASALRVRCSAEKMGVGNSYSGWFQAGVAADLTRIFDYPRQDCLNLPMCNLNESLTTTCDVATSAAWISRLSDSNGSMRASLYSARSKMTLQVSCNRPLSLAIDFPNVKFFHGGEGQGEGDFYICASASFDNKPVSPLIQPPATFSPDLGGRRDMKSIDVDGVHPERARHSQPG